MPEGYPDYQRIANFDGPLLYSKPNQLVNGTVESPRLAVSRYLSTAGNMSPGIGGEPDVEVTFQWWSAEKAGFLIASRTFILSKETSLGANFNIRNEGPWLVVRTTIANGHWSIQMFASNRALDVEFVTQEVTAFHVSEVLAPAAEKIFFPPILASGPTQVFAQMLGNTIGIAVDMATTPAGYTALYQVGLLENEIKNDRLILPSTAWRVRTLTGAKAGGTLVFTLSTSTSGSS